MPYICKLLLMSSAIQERGAPCVQVQFITGWADGDRRMRRLSLWSWKLTHSTACTKCIRCVWRGLGVNLCPKFSTDLNGERLFATQQWPGSATQSSWDVAEHPEGGKSGNKLQGCPELYRNLLLTAESYPGLRYSYNTAAQQQGANTARQGWKRTITHFFL